MAFARDRKRRLEEELTKIDALLLSRGLCRSLVPKDGSCAFRAIAEGALQSQAQHTRLRALCVSYLSARQEQYEPFIDIAWRRFITELALPGTWAGNIEIQAVGAALNIGISVWTVAGGERVVAPTLPSGRSIALAYTGGNHFDLVRPIARASTAEMCQALVYRMINRAVKLPEDCDVSYRNVPMEVWIRDLARQRRKDAAFANAVSPPLEVEEDPVPADAAKRVRGKNIKPPPCRISSRPLSQSKAKSEPGTGPSPVSPNSPTSPPGKSWVAVAVAPKPGAKLPASSDSAKPPTSSSATVKAETGAKEAPDTKNCQLSATSATSPRPKQALTPTVELPQGTASPMSSDTKTKPELQVCVPGTSSKPLCIQRRPQLVPSQK